MFCCSLLIPIPVSVTTILSERVLTSPFVALAAECEFEVTDLETFVESLDVAAFLSFILSTSDGDDDNRLVAIGDPLLFFWGST